MMHQKQKDMLMEKNIFQVQPKMIHIKSAIIILFLINCSISQRAPEDGRYIRTHSEDRPCTSSRCTDNNRNRNSDQLYSRDEYRTNPGQENPKSDEYVSYDERLSSKDESKEDTPKIILDEKKPKYDDEDPNTKTETRDDYEHKLDEYSPKSVVSTVYEPKSDPRPVRREDSDREPEFRDPKLSSRDEYKPSPAVREEFNPKPAIHDEYESKSDRRDEYNPKLDRRDEYNPKPDIRDEYNPKPVTRDEYNPKPDTRDEYNPKPGTRDEFNPKLDARDEYNPKPNTRRDEYNPKPNIRDEYEPKPNIRGEEYPPESDVRDEYKPKPTIRDEYTPNTRSEYNPHPHSTRDSKPVRGEHVPASRDSYNPKPTSREEDEYKPVVREEYKPRPSARGEYDTKPNVRDDYDPKPSVPDYYNPRPNVRDGNEPQHGRDRYDSKPDVTGSRRPAHSPRPSYTDDYDKRPVREDERNSKPPRGGYGNSRPKEDGPRYPERDSKYDDRYGSSSDKAKPDIDNCICVPYYQCKAGHIVTDGDGIIDARMKPYQDEEEDELPLDGKFRPPSCGPFHVCCNTPETSTVTPYEHRCGVRNPSGINSRVLSPSNKGEADFGEWPWQAAVLKSEGTVNIFQCGGVLIDKYHILTVAHCVFHLQKYNNIPLKVRLGEWDTQTASEFLAHEDYKVSKITIHEEYRNASLWNDIAILRLQEPVQFAPHIDTICLPKYDEAFSGQNCVVTGWGKDSYKGGTFSNVMKEVALQVIDNYNCEEMLRKTRLGRFFQLHEGFVCAGGEHGLDACKGDGGGPLVCYRKDRSYALAGIVSWGVDCGQPEVPGVYVKVQRYLNWISKNTGVELHNYWPKA